LNNILFDILLENYTLITIFVGIVQTTDSISIVIVLLWVSQ